MSKYTHQIVVDNAESVILTITEKIKVGFVYNKASRVAKTIKEKYSRKCIMSEKSKAAINLRECENIENGKGVVTHLDFNRELRFVSFNPDVHAASFTSGAKHLKFSCVDDSFQFSILGIGHQALVVPMWDNEEGDLSDFISYHHQMDIFVYLQSIATELWKELENVHSQLEGKDLQSFHTHALVYKES